MRAERQALAARPQELAARSEALQARLVSLPEYLRAGGVFCFVAMEGEPETRPLIADALARGKRVFVPLCEKGGIMHPVEITSLKDLAPGMCGILEPLGGARVLPGEIDFAVIPALACTESGARLGQGGGYYDRFLVSYGGAYAAVCFEQFIYPALPEEEHDRKTPLIATERRVIRADAGGTMDVEVETGL